MGSQLRVHEPSEFRGELLKSSTELSYMEMPLLSIGVPATKFMKEDESVFEKPLCLNKVIQVTIVVIFYVIIKQ